MAIGDAEIGDKKPERTPYFSVTLFGSFGVSRAGRDLRPRSRKTTGLLAFLLASDRQGVTRTRLANLFWSDRAEQQARNSLRQALLELRGCGLEEAVEVTRTDVTLARSSFVTDVERIATLAQCKNRAGLEVALAAIDGAFLEDLDGLSPAFDEWLRPERARQRERLFALALRCVTGGGASPCAEDRPLLAELERIDPLDENVARLRMRIDAATGDMAALHRRFRRLTEDLSRELSVTPSQESRELLRTLVTRPTILVARQSEPASAPTTPLAEELGRTGPPLLTITPFGADGDADVARFAATVTDSVAGSLSRSTEFRVAISDTGTDASPRGAMAVFFLRGNARQIGDTVFVNVHLMEGLSGQLIWSEEAEVDRGAALRVGPLVERVCGAIGPAIDHALAERAATERPTVKDEPSALYSRGKRLVDAARTLEHLGTGMALLSRVIELDPRHVGARVRLARLYNTDLHFLIAGHDVAEMRERAFQLVLEAAELQPDDARVQLLLAWCRLRRSDWHVAERLLHGIEQRMPHDPDTMNACGFALACLGEIEAGRQLLQRAFRLNPFPPAEYHADFAVLSALAGDHEEAEAHFVLCGEQRLFWRVIRLCNLHRLGRSGPQTAALDARFVATFRTIWVRETSPGLDDLLDWGRTTFCLRRPEHQRLIADGITAAWASQTPAVVDNGS